MRRSSLDEIPGLGHHRQKLLLAEFRSIDYIREASPEQLATVPGIGMQIAKQIYQYFHPGDEGLDEIPEATNSEVVS